MDRSNSYNCTIQSLRQVDDYSVRQSADGPGFRGGLTKGRSIHRPVVSRRTHSLFTLSRRLGGEKYGAARLEFGDVSLCTLVHHTLQIAVAEHTT
jgi:hypothetical protein